MTDVSPAAVVFSGRLYLFAKSILAPKIYVTSTGNGVTWTDWGLSPSGGLTNAPLAAAAFKSLYLFAKGLDAKIYMSSSVDAVTWTTWDEVPGSPADEVGSLTNASLAAATFSGRLYLFAKGILDSKIYVNSVSPAL